VVVEIERLAADVLLGATTERGLIVVAALTRPIGRHFWVEPALARTPRSGAGSARLLVMAARLAEAVASS
jgi:hypothetical protein